MSSEHKRPLYAFMVVSLLCAVMLGHAIRSDAIQTLFTPGGSTAAVAAPISPASQAPSRSAAPDAPATDVDSATAEAATSTPTARRGDRRGHAVAVPVRGPSGTAQAVPTGSAGQGEGKATGRDPEHSGKANGHHKAKGHHKGKAKGKAVGHHKDRSEEARAARKAEREAAKADKAASKAAAKEARKAEKDAVGGADSVSARRATPGAHTLPEQASDQAQAAHS